MTREAFDQWRDSLPEKHWAKYDLSACKLGFDAGWQLAMRYRDEQDAAGTPACAGCGEPANDPHTSDCPMVDRDEQEKPA